MRNGEVAPENMVRVRMTRNPYGSSRSAAGCPLGTSLEALKLALGIDPHCTEVPSFGRH